MENSLTIVFVLAGAPMAALIGTAFFVRSRLRAGRRWPLTRGLLRMPGFSLRKEMEDVLSNVAIAFLMPVFAVTLLYALYLQQVIAGRGSVITQAILGTFAIGAVAYAAWKLRGLMTAYRNLSLGFEAESAAGEELNRLMRHGYWVFHDVPGDKAFNVDHIVVGPGGVFAVETKGRAKPNGDVQDGHKVRSDGERLQFPTWVETKPIEQATMNAKWISAWLSSAVGEPVRATPVVLIPGWWVDRTSGNGVVVLNEKQCEAYFLKVVGNRLSEQQIKRIAHQLDQRCREPTREG